MRAFAPVLQNLRSLIQDASSVIDRDYKLPDGLRTPRVRRAFQVLLAQLDEASKLADYVQPDLAPQIDTCIPSTGSHGLTNYTLTGTNFRNPASAILLVENREDLPDVPSRHAHAQSQTSATASFRIPRHGPYAGQVNWQLVFTNGDGTYNDPPFPVNI